MKLVESILTKNPCYTAGRKITVKGLMLHSVGCPQPSAQVFVKNWNSASYDRACVHGFIDGNDGTIYQCLPWDHRGWHCGASGNNTHIGVEMCEPACIKYTGGATFTCSDKATAQAVTKRTYEAAVELFAMLCQKFSLDPLGDGVIVSHKEGCKRGIASNHGDPEHLWTQLGLPYTMDTFRKAVKAAMGGGAAAPSGVFGTKIMGVAVATADQMRTYLKAKNPKVAQSVLDMVPLYLSEGAAEGVRGDIAFAQSCLETGNFGFAGSAVTLDQNNFCGMGVTANGMKGNSFSTAQLGMLHSLAAQIDYYRDFIQNNPDWEFAGVYADESKTGTKEDREQFQRLLTDCRAGAIDMVVTKSISRFARNTVTLLETVRELKALGVEVCFEEQNIYTFSADGEMALTLLASFAQAESLSCSDNCKWRIRKGFEVGRANSCTMLGCPTSKAIPEGTLKAACAQVLGLRSFEDGAFTLAITAIDACPDNLLRFHFRDGYTAEYRWQDRSRRESWTAEMRETARQRALAGR